jgi:hypothetical protein
MSDVPFRLESANFTRPADTTAYASGDLVANNTTAGSVVPLSWNIHRNPSGSVRIKRAKIKKSTNVTTNASFRLHLYTSSPTVTNGDNGAWLSTESGYLGFIDVTVDKAFSDGSANHFAPVYSTAIDVLVRLTGTKGIASEVKIYGLLEARAAYTPGSAEVFTVSLEIEPQ